MTHPIFIDDTIRDPQTQRGVTRYFNNVVDGIISTFGDQIIIYSEQQWNDQTSRHISASTNYSWYQRFYHDAKASYLTFRNDSSVYFSGYYGNVITSAKQIYIVYDMIDELFPHFHPRESWRSKLFILEKKCCLERAKTLIAISKNTKKDIISLYPNLDPAKIVVIPPGVEQIFLADITDKANYARKPYFLYIGRRGLYKNFLRLLIAFGESGFQKDFDLWLVSSQASLFTEQEVEYIKKFHLEKNLVQIVSPSDPDLCEIYSNAVGLVYPSEYEGFGIPIIEALASGTLVATSDVASMPEAGGEAAFYFNPLSIDSIMNGLKLMAFLSSDERKKRITIGKDHAREFTWARCQAQMLDVFRNILS